MSVTRVSTIAVYSKTISDMMSVQTDTAKIRQQITSARKAADFKEMGSDVTKVMDLESSIRSAKKFIQGNNVASGRLKQMDLAVANIQTIASDLKSNLVLEKSNGGALNLRQFATAALEQLEGLLNTRQGGRSLFSGARIDQNAVGDLTVSTNILSGVATSNYYQGDNMKVSIKATSELEIKYGVNASDSAFANLIAALNKAIEVDDTGASSDFVQAGDFLDNAISQLVDVRSGINSNIIILDGINSQHLRTQDELGGILSDTVGTDIVEASIQLALNESVLTATLQSFARISRLNLADFLR